MATIQEMLEKLVDAGYIRTSDITTIGQLLLDELKASLTDEVLPKGVLADKLAEANKMLAAAKHELSETVKSKASVVDTSRGPGVNATFSMWHPPNKPEDMRIYVNARGLKKVSLVQDNTDPDKMLVRAQYGRAALRQEIAIVAEALTEIGLSECTWPELLAYVTAIEAKRAEAAGTDLSVIKSMGPGAV